MVFGCLGVKDEQEGQVNAMIVVDFQTMVRLNGWRSMGLHLDTSATLGGFVCCC